MSLLELRWIRRHPFRWLKASWFHWTVATVLLCKAILITDPLWQVTAGSQLWPIFMGGAATMCIASSIAITDHRLQRATALTLLGLSVWRITTYLLVMAATDSHNTAVLALAFAFHWALIGLVATRWPIISTHAALIVTVDSGRDTGRLRATG